MVSNSESRITSWLRNTSGFWFAVYATLMAFSLYTCVYAFRKTFSVATFDDISYAGISFKVWLVTFPDNWLCMFQICWDKSYLRAKSKIAICWEFLLQLQLPESPGYSLDLFQDPTTSFFFLPMASHWVWCGEWFLDISREGDTRRC